LLHNFSYKKGSLDSGALARDDRDTHVHSFWNHVRMLNKNHGVQCSISCISCKSCEIPAGVYPALRCGTGMTCRYNYFYYKRQSREHPPVVAAFFGAAGHPRISFWEFFLKISCQRFSKKLTSHWRKNVMLAVEISISFSAVCWVW